MKKVVEKSVTNGDQQFAKTKTSSDVAQTGQQQTKPVDESLSRSSRAAAIRKRRPQAAREL